MHLDDNISAHFTFRELTHSALAVRHGLLNEPNSDEIQNLIHLAENILEPVRDHFDIPFRPSSGYRSLAVNQLLGSPSTSQHITGEAVDFEIPSVSNRDVAAWVKDHLSFDQMILEFHQPDIPHSGWLHCSYRAGNNRQQSLMFDGKIYREF